MLHVYQIVNIVVLENKTCSHMTYFTMSKIHTKNWPKYPLFAEVEVKNYKYSRYCTSVIF